MSSHPKPIQIIVPESQKAALQRQSQIQETDPSKLVRQFFQAYLAGELEALVPDPSTGLSIKVPEPLFQALQAEAQGLGVSFPTLAKHIIAAGLRSGLTPKHSPAKDVGGLNENSYQQDALSYMSENKDEFRAHFDARGIICKNLEEELEKLDEWRMIQASEFMASTLDEG